MASLFTRIVNKEIPCYKVFEDENYLAFLDIFPLVKGHTLLIPKIEIDDIFDIHEPIFSGLWQTSKTLASGIKKSFPCQKVGITVIGLEVPHAHIHLIPIHSMSDMNFANPKLQLSKKEFEEIAERIKNNL
ncbi:MAG: HIT family protein [Flavobacteriales bacterium]|nr:HIT family protein [Flavobacteriales bacterium]